MNTIYYTYKITNHINNKIYIGKTNDPAKRWKEHEKLATSNSKHFYIHNAINKYGSNMFLFEVIKAFDDENDAYDHETFLIKLYNSNDSQYGYNLTLGGRGIKTGLPVSLETRKKISDAQKLESETGIKRKKVVIQSPKARIKMKEANKNRGKVSIEIKKEILFLFETGEYTKKSLSEKFDIRIESINFIISYYKKNGFKNDAEKRQNRSLAKKGKKLTEEHKQKMSDALKGIIFTEERRSNISKALTGKSPPQKTRDKIAITLSGRQDYPELKRKIIDLFLSGNFRKIDLAKMFNLKYSVVKVMLKKYKSEIKNV